MNDSDNRSTKIPSRCQPNLGAESLFFSHVGEVETTQMDPTLVKQLRSSLQQPLPQWSVGLGKTYLLSAVDSPEPRRVMVNGWGKVRSLFLSGYNISTTSPLGLRAKFQNNNFTYDRGLGLSSRNDETVPGHEAESYNQQSGDSRASEGVGGSRITVEASGSANDTSFGTVGAKGSVKSRESTPEDESFDGFVQHITSY